MLIKFTYFLEETDNLAFIEKFSGVVAEKMTYRIVGYYKNGVLPENLNTKYINGKILESFDTETELDKAFKKLYKKVYSPVWR